MAARRPLKVYRTTIGFHDAYIATTSQKAALEAWGSERNLFSMGAAQVVTDPALTAEPLAHPGRIIRVSRGNLEAHLKAASQDTRIERTASRPIAGRASRREDARKPRTTSQPPEAKPERRPKPKPEPKPEPRRKPKPPPSRHALNIAQEALEAFEEDARAEIAGIETQIAALREKRDELRRKHSDRRERLRTELERAKADHAIRVQRWRGT